MRNLNDEDSYNYSPNELAQLSIDNNKLYREIVNSNLEDGKTIEEWEQENLKRMQKWLK